MLSAYFCVKMRIYQERELVKPPETGIGTVHA